MPLLRETFLTAAGILRRLQTLGAPVPGLDADKLDGSHASAFAIATAGAPVGAVIAFLKSYTNTPSLPAGWVECNGQVLSDAASVYDTQTIPNLNASGGGTKRFLRGSTTSGTTGGADSHTHTLSAAFNPTTTTVSNSTTTTTVVTGGTVTGTATAPSGSTGLPSYYEVVWIIRVK